MDRIEMERGHRSGVIGLDLSGQRWLIFEMDAANVPGARAPRCLVLDGGTACRRLWQYPLDWRSRALDDLLDLPPL